MYKNKTQISVENTLAYNLYISRKMYIFIYSAAALACILIGFLFFKNDKVIAISLWVASVVVIPIMFLFSARNIKKQIIKLMKNNPMQDENNITEFIFESEYITINNYRFEQMTNSGKAYYNMLNKIVEHKKYLFIFIGHNLAHILDVNFMTEGDADNLKQFLRQTLNTKYIKK